MPSDELPNECPSGPACPNHPALVRLARTVRRLLAHRDAYNDAVAFVLEQHNAAEKALPAPQAKPSPGTDTHKP